MRKLIDIISVLINRFYPLRWKINPALKSVLIYEQDAYRFGLFSQFIKSNKLTEKYNIKVTKNKLEFIRCSSFADVIYSYGLSKLVKTKNLKFLYIGIVGGTVVNNTSDFKIVNAPNYAYKHISNYILSTVLMQERRLSNAVDFKNNKQWIQTGFIEANVRIIDDLKIGILGLGKVGLETANIFVRLGAEVHAYDINIEKISKPTTIISYDNSNWESMLSAVDYFIITINNNESNESLINEVVLAKMHQGLVVVNVARGNIIDENKLVEFIKKGKIKGAILDVFKEEPLPRNNKLWNLNNVLITPHIAGNINLVFEEILNDFFEKIEKNV